MRFVVPAMKCYPDPQPEKSHATKCRKSGSLSYYELWRMRPHRIAKDGRGTRQHGTPVDPGTVLSLYDVLSALIQCSHMVALLRI